MYRLHVLRVLSAESGSGLPKCSVVAGTIFHRLRPPSHLLYKLIAGICGAEHSHQSFPLLGHSPASTFISQIIKLVMFAHSSLTDVAIVTLLSYMRLIRDSQIPMLHWNLLQPYSAELRFATRQRR